MTAQKPTLDDLQRWFILSWATMGAGFIPLREYVEEKLPSDLSASGDDTFADKALEALAANLHKCRAISPQQLRQWCYKQIDRLAAAVNKRKKKVRKNTKPFRYEQHGEKCFIPLRDSKGKEHLWIIPASWLETARQLWPVYLRRYPDKRLYVARKVSVLQPDGSREQIEIGLHRIFMGLGAAKHNFDDAGEVTAQDGSWLNFAGDNLRLIKGSDLLDYCRQLSQHHYLATADWRPAQRTKTNCIEGRSNSWNWHELSVRRWLGGGSDEEIQLPEPEEDEISAHPATLEENDEDFS